MIREMTYGNLVVEMVSVCVNDANDTITVNKKKFSLK
jgi:hypothetical protein